MIALVVLGLGGVVAAILFFSSRDQSNVTPTLAPGVLFPDQGDKHLAPGKSPGVKYNSTPPTSGPHVLRTIKRDGLRLGPNQVLTALEQGNILIFYPGHGKPPAALRAVQSTDSGPLDPALLETGNQVVLARYDRVRRVVAVGWRRMLVADSPSDPRIQAFTDDFLGRPLGR